MTTLPETKKSLGQHFLNDNRIIRNIVDAIPAHPTDRIIEIGAGAGALTGALLERYENVVAVEIDRRMVKVLSEKFPQLRIVEKDILKCNWMELGDVDSPVHIVGNLPYYITSQILFSVLEHRFRLSSAVLMMQKEVARRIVASSGNKEYGILSVQVQLMSTPDILFDVPSGAFTPPPAVDSSVIKLMFDRSPLGCSDENLKRVVRMAFNQRRKKLRNALKRLDAELPDDEFDFDLRAEALDPGMYEKLTVRLEQLGTFR